MRNKRLEMRLTNDEWKRLHDCKGYLTVSQFVREAISEKCKSEDKEAHELIESLREMKADLDYVVGVIRRLLEVQNGK